MSLVRTEMHFQVETHGAYQGLDVSETRLDPIYGHFSTENDDQQVELVSWFASQLGWSLD